MDTCQVSYDVMSSEQSDWCQPIFGGTNIFLLHSFPDSLFVSLANKRTKDNIIDSYLTSVRSSICGKTWKMCFNPSKCEFLRLTNKKNIIKFQYSIQGNNIREVHQVKYLGVTINNNLSWSAHTKNISSKANSVLGFLRRNFNRCPTKTKSALYLSLVRPILEYAVTVWAPYHRTDICQIEAIQRRAARFAMNCYDRHQSVTEMLHKLTWPTLESRRNHFKIIMMFKIINNMVHIQPDVPITYARRTNTRGHHLKMQQPATRTDVYLHSFFPSTVKLWNLLPSNLIDSPSLNSFKCNLVKLN